MAATADGTGFLEVTTPPLVDQRHLRLSPRGVVTSLRHRIFVRCAPAHSTLNEVV